MLQLMGTERYGGVKAWSMNSCSAPCLKILGVLLNLGVYKARKKVFVYTAKRIPRLCPFNGYSNLNGKLLS